MNDAVFKLLLDFLLSVINKIECQQDFREQVLAKLEVLKIQGETIMATIDDVKAKVTAQTTVIGGAVTLLKELKAKLDAAGTDPVKLQALSDEIGANTDALAKAVVDNTPAAPAPSPIP